MMSDPKHKTPRDPAYLRWLRTQPCDICGREPPSEASHHGPHGVGIKASDHLALPMCFECHRRQHFRGSPHARWDVLSMDERRKQFARIAQEDRDRYLCDGDPLDW